MRTRLKRALCYLVLITMILLAPQVARELPSGAQNVLRELNASWSGVLRLWVCEGWQPGYGSLTPWLASCIAQFEKAHPGVYVQPKPVPLAALARFASGDAPPPDLILFAPGMLESAAGLAALAEPVGLRPELAGMGLDSGRRYACPVALGGYCWVYNTKLLRELPGDWSQAPQPIPAKQAAKQKVKELYLMQAPADGAFLSWSAGLIALCAISRTEDAGGPQAQLPGSGLDLGLPVISPTPGLATPAPKVTQLPCALPKLRPDDFLETESAYAAFTSGQAAAIPATQREIRRLQVLGESGRAPEWAVAAPGQAFTDQVALISVVRSQWEDAAARESLSQQFVAHLVSEESQQKLALARAFPVADTAALYAGQQGMEQLEAAMAGRTLLTPPAFGGGWRTGAQQLAREFASGSLSAHQALLALGRLCGFSP